MIGIIGFGRFGKLAARYLAKDFKVFVNTRADKTSEISLAGGQAASLEEVCQQDIIIPCVPISVFEDFLIAIAPRIKPDALIIDVCSVKEYPVHRPLLGFDKAETEALGRKIGTYKLSSTKASACGAVPYQPSTKAKLEDVIKAEEKLDIEAMVERSLESIKIIEV